jgi:hypothetical protein
MKGMVEFYFADAAKGGEGEAGGIAEVEAPGVALYYKATAAAPNMRGNYYGGC